ncbi:efflux transporter outer membrane subunit [Colwellia sp. 1_MG-2023]|uniref:efflux transporter outer membrane subunit n=1 Tax=unclassified Colwellia TaxID=196834 RepID=UPI001C0988CE|nr:MULTISPECIES: efflux transporter outer membrane subunit [unclassified Colwellia]MBU2926333.1 efflux transporter outer membrane subunit [Colwellia sp. C2M11]MDO6651771.1 efflux transporter outer membrane subunit [Colwellia sp. 3_MG-2023]MDO6665318.1 efflux transporter outer membrane subunit [Colwellia sp. 2_MG-2023]MDO6689691.1 efflux transporter outer membrane subunit [Colwellia sp. 1_MG-2023]
MTFKTFSLASLSVVVLSACQMAPPREDIVLPVPESYAVQSQQGDITDLHWQQFFTNEKLQKLIEQTLTHNKDIKLAALNVQQVRALYQIEDSALYPSLDFSASGTRQRLPSDLSSTGSAQISESYSATVGMTAYELDLWGKVRNQSDQALQTLYASEQTQTSVKISLISELANAWLNYAADKEQLTLAMETLKSQQASLALTEKSYALGAASKLTLAQIQSTVAAAKVDIANYQRMLKRDKNALDLLVGKPVAADLLPIESLDEVLNFPNVPVGLPSELLEQRPDIKAAEFKLLAANANIGVAKAAFFPSITLTANAGTASADLDNLFSGGTGTWSFIPSITIPIFNMGRNQANLDVAQTQQEIALASYEQTIQQAFREVSDALTDREGYMQQLSALEELYNSNKVSFTLSEARFEKGADSYLQVLDAQRNWYSAGQQLISGKQAYITSQISLYKAIGGGWQRPTQQSK